MKRISVVLIVAVLLMGTAQAHPQKSRVDGKNPNMPLDMRRVYLDHDDTNLYFDLETRGSFSNSQLKVRGGFAVNIWRPETKGYFYQVFIYKAWSGLKARIYRVEKKEDGDFTTVGWGRAEKTDVNVMSVRIERSSVEADGDGKMKWTSWSAWCEGDDCKFDWVPKGTAYTHNLGA